MQNLSINTMLQFSDSIEQRSPIRRITQKIEGGDTFTRIFNSPTWQGKVRARSPMARYLFDRNNSSSLSPHKVIENGVLDAHDFVETELYKKIAPVQSSIDKSNVSKSSQRRRKSSTSQISPPAGGFGASNVFKRNISPKASGNQSNRVADSMSPAGKSTALLYSLNRHAKSTELLHHSPEKVRLDETDNPMASPGKLCSRRIYGVSVPRLHEIVQFDNHLALLQATASPPRSLLQHHFGIIEGTADDLDDSHRYLNSALIEKRKINSNGNNFDVTPWNNMSPHATTKLISSNPVIHVMDKSSPRILPDEHIIYNKTASEYTDHHPSNSFPNYQNANNTFEHYNQDSKVSTNYPHYSMKMDAIDSNTALKGDDDDEGQANAADFDEFTPVQQCLPSENKKTTTNKFPASNLIVSTRIPGTATHLPSALETQLKIESMARRNHSPPAGSNSKSSAVVLNNNESQLQTIRLGISNIEQYDKVQDMFHDDSGFANGIHHDEQKTLIAARKKQQQFEECQRISDDQATSPPHLKSPAGKATRRASTVLVGGGMTVAPIIMSQPSDHYSFLSPCKNQFQLEGKGDNGSDATFVHPLRSASGAKIVGMALDGSFLLANPGKHETTGYFDSTKNNVFKEPVFLSGSGAHLEPITNLQVSNEGSNIIYHDQSPQFVDEKMYDFTSVPNLPSDLSSAGLLDLKDAGKNTKTINRISGSPMYPMGISPKRKEGSYYSIGQAKEGTIEYGFEPLDLRKNTILAGKPILYEPLTLHHNNINNDNNNSDVIVTQPQMIKNESAELITVPPPTTIVNREKEFDYTSKSPNMPQDIVILKGVPLIIPASFQQQQKRVAHLASPSAMMHSNEFNQNNLSALSSPKHVHSLMNSNISNNNLSDDLNHHNNNSSKPFSTFQINPVEPVTVPFTSSSAILQNLNLNLSTPNSNLQLSEPYGGTPRRIGAAEGRPLPLFCDGAHVCSPEAPWTKDMTPSAGFLTNSSVNGGISNQRVTRRQFVHLKATPEVKEYYKNIVGGSPLSKAAAAETSHLEGVGRVYGHSVAVDANHLHELLANVSSSSQQQTTTKENISRSSTSPSPAPISPQSKWVAPIYRPGSDEGSSSPLIAREVVKSHQSDKQQTTQNKLINSFGLPTAVNVSFSPPSRNVDLPFNIHTQASNNSTSPSYTLQGSATATASTNAIVRSRINQIYPSSSLLISQPLLDVKQQDNLINTSLNSVSPSNNNTIYGLPVYNTSMNSVMNRTNSVSLHGCTLGTTSTVMQQFENQKIHNSQRLDLLTKVAPQMNTVLDPNLQTERALKAGLNTFLTGEQSFISGDTADDRAFARFCGDFAIAKNSSRGKNIIDKSFERQYDLISNVDFNSNTTQFKNSNLGIKGTKVTKSKGNN